MKTILIVDDNHYVLDFLKDMVLRWGHRVIATRDGQSALAVLNQGEAADLVVTDYQMPGMNGLELVEKLKQIAPSVPVVMMSASLRVDIYLKAMALGVIEFFEKPTEPRALRKVIEHALIASLVSETGNGKVRPNQRAREKPGPGTDAENRNSANEPHF